MEILTSGAALRAAALAVLGAFPDELGIDPVTLLQ